MVDRTSQICSNRNLHRFILRGMVDRTSLIWRVRNLCRFIVRACMVDRTSLIGASLSEPHTSEKFGTVVTYTNNYEKRRTISVTTTGKSERFPYFIDTIVHVAKDNKHSLLTLFTICLDVHVAKNNKCLVGTVVRVAENNDLSLRSYHEK